MKIVLSVVAAVFALAAQTGTPAAPPGPAGAKPFAYEQTETRPLYLYVLSPPQNVDRPRTAIVFFFGGGWTSGSPTQFAPQGEYFASTGRVCIFVDYRVRSRDHSTPFDSVVDAKAAMRWVRQHAGELHIAPDRIVAAGGSAGGHLALSAAVFGDSAAEIPNALVLYNPVVDTTGLGYGQNLFGGRDRELSPVHHLSRGLPPTIVFHGTGDRTVPFENAERFVSGMKALANECELVAFPGADHGFFNSPEFRKGSSPEIYESVLKKTESFLKSLGF